MNSPFSLYGAVFPSGEESIHLFILFCQVDSEAVRPLFRTSLSLQVSGSPCCRLETDVFHSPESMDRSRADIHLQGHLESGCSQGWRCQQPTGPDRAVASASGFLP